MILNILNPDIAFDGWATALVILLLTGLLGIGAYKLVSKNKISQKQKAGDYSKQEQSVSSNTNKDENIIRQTQKAGDNSNQKQSV